MKKYSDLLLVIISLSLSFGFGVALIFGEKSDFSEKENRMLTDSVSLTPRALLRGDLPDKLSSFCSDQFPLRDRFTYLKAICELSMLRGENNGVVFASDGYTVISHRYTDLSLYEKNLSHLAAFVDSHDAVVCLAPRGADLLSFALPSAYSDSTLELTFNMAKESLHSVIDTRKELSDAILRGEYVWFRTDHHWTQKGAYLAYLKICDALCVTPAEVSEPIVLSDSFLGSVYSRSGRLNSTPDSLEIITHGNFNMYIEETGENFDSIYFPDNLEKKDKYLYFAAGNHGHISIGKRDGGKETLAVIKDSYANAMLPLLAENFDLEVYDLRYFSGNINAELASVSPDRILVLCGIDTLVTDSSFSALSR